MSLLRAFYAGAVHRWHTNPWLAGTSDRVDGHAARVARIILMWHPSPSVNLIGAALIHDDGEHAVGDIKAPFKTMRPDIAEALAVAEAHAAGDIWGCDAARIADGDDIRWMIMADKLDAYMWAAHHGAPMDRDGWPEEREVLAIMADGLGVLDNLQAVLREVGK
jgi:hypothetical protein